MAQVTIIVSDTADGEVDLHLESEPSFKKDIESTPAQNAALLMLGAVTDASQGYKVTDMR